MLVCLRFGVSDCVHDFACVFLILFFFLCFCVLVELIWVSCLLIGGRLNAVKPQLCEPSCEIIWHLLE